MKHFYHSFCNIIPTSALSWKLVSAVFSTRVEIFLGICMPGNFGLCLGHFEYYVMRSKVLLISCVGWFFFFKFCLFFVLFLKICFKEDWFVQFDASMNFIFCGLWFFYISAFFKAFVLLLRYVLCVLSTSGSLGSVHFSKSVVRCLGSFFTYAACRWSQEFINNFMGLLFQGLFSVHCPWYFLVLWSSTFWSSGQITKSLFIPCCWAIPLILPVSEAKHWRGRKRNGSFPLLVF